MSVSLHKLNERAQAGEKLVCLTAYDASFATLAHQAGVDMLLVGDSLGMVIQGHSTTLPVTLEDIVYHLKAVRRGAPEAFVIADMPFGSFQGSYDSALKHAVKLMRHGASMVKLEGGQVVAELTAYLVQRGIPVMAHLGFTPQSVNVLGYRVQGKSSEQADQLMRDALLHQSHGASMVLMEMVPSQLAQRVTQTLSIPTVGIGAGAFTSAQVLVLYDILGIYPGKSPRFSHNFLTGCDSVLQAIKNYVDAVKSGQFPQEKHSFSVVL